MERFALGLSVRNPGLAADAYPILISHPWPGNVRELANLMEQCLIFSRGHRVAPETVQRLLNGTQETTSDPFRQIEEAVAQGFQRAVDDDCDDLLEIITNRVARRIIGEALRHTAGNRTRAAKLLGVSRPTLLAKMRKHRLT